MRHVLQHAWRAGVIAATVVVAAGCGGGDDATTPTSQTPAASTPSTTPGALVNNTTTTTTPGATAGTTGGATASAAVTIPDLAGGDIAGGIASSSGGGVFVAKAVNPAKAAEQSSVIERLGSGQVPTISSTGSSAGGTSKSTTYTSASIYVDGIVHSVAKNGTFPKGNPVFRLAGITATDIELELVAGEFTSGGGTGIFLDKSELVTLYNASDRISYKVKYLRPIASSTTITY